MEIERFFKEQISRRDFFKILGIPGFLLPLKEALANLPVSTKKDAFGAFVFLENGEFLGKALNFTVTLEWPDGDDGLLVTNAWPPVEGRSSYKGTFSSDDFQIDRRHPLRSFYGKRLPVYMGIKPLGERQAFCRGGINFLANKGVWINLKEIYFNHA